MRLGSIFCRFCPFENQTWPSLLTAAREVDIPENTPSEESKSLQGTSVILSSHQRWISEVRTRTSPADMYSHSDPCPSSIILIMLFVAEPAPSFSVRFFPSCKRSRSFAGYAHDPSRSGTRPKPAPSERIGSKLPS